MGLTDLFRRRDSQLRVSVESAVQRGVSEAIRRFRGDLDKLTDLDRLREEKATLNEQIEKLKLERDRKQEEFDRREREIEHKVGLERLRQEQERELARREASADAREENQKQAEKSFDERMKFFRDELDDQKELLHKVLERLPSAEIFAEIGGTRNGKGGD